MLYDPKHDDQLGDTLSTATAVTPALMSRVVSQACVRLHAQSSAAKARLNRLIESGAWTDAVLALLELELPQWKLRRIAYEDGEWFCALSREPWLPLGLDEATEATHEILPIAVLIAFLRARYAAPVSTTAVTAVPKVGTMWGNVVCCDNFS